MIMRTGGAAPRARRSSGLLWCICWSALLFDQFSADSRHVVILDTSRLWTNYRHSANVLAFYSIVRELGIPEHRISLFMNGDVACSPQNVFSGSVFHSKDRELYKNVDIDHKGEEISREKLMRLLESRVLPFVPRSRRLNTNPDSRTTVFLTGHSGIGFSKIQDLEEYSAFDIANSLQHMQDKGRYDKMLWIGDTCRAASLHNEFYSPNVLAVGSSKERQSSYSRHGDLTLGVSVVDRFSYHAEQTLKSTLIDRKDLQITVDKFSQMFDFSILMSDLSLRSDLLSGSERLVDFFGGTDRLDRLDIRIGKWDVSGTKRESPLKESGEIDTSIKKSLHLNPVQWLSPYLSILMIMGFIILVGIS